MAAGLNDLPSTPPIHPSSLKLLKVELRQQNLILIEQTDVSDKYRSHYISHFDHPLLCLPDKNKYLNLTPVFVVQLLVGGTYTLQQKSKN